ncbi:MAG TPA: prolipoprotein diacylglyceryl transferase [Patescibacteria group bacterium]|nr:prolipoprotein diacylglyceryl transferase [Patescibacteria group bacterium]
MLTLGPITFHLYGLMIGLGILAAGLVAERLRQRLKKTDKLLQKFIVWDTLLYIVAFGLVGARLYHVIDLWGYYWLNPGKIIYLWEGGMGIFGGIAGGLIGAWLATKDKKIFIRLIDLIAVGAPLGQAIGRLGNYFNQELYGLPTKLPWGIYIKPENRFIELFSFDRYHPLFLYEMIWNVMVFGILYFVAINRKVKIGTGVLFISYLGLYSFGRFFLEFLKINPWQVYGVNVAQAISLALMTVAVIKLRRL